MLTTKDKQWVVLTFSFQSCYQNYNKTKPGFVFYSFRKHKTQITYSYYFTKHLKLKAFNGGFFPPLQNLCICSSWAAAYLYCYSKAINKGVFLIVPGTLGTPGTALRASHCPGQHMCGLASCVSRRSSNSISCLFCRLLRFHHDWTQSAYSSHPPPKIKPLLLFSSRCSCFHQTIKGSMRINCSKSVWSQSVSQQRTHTSA